MMRAMAAGSLACVAAMWTVVADARAGEAAAPAAEVLGEGTIWRFHMSYRPFHGECGRATPLTRTRWVRWGEELAGPVPDAGWTAAEFDDSAWPRGRAPFLEGYGGGRAYVGTPLICLRGRFGVADPARAAGLDLTLAYRGGAVVYLNGREIARLHVPAGAVGPLTPAEAYPREAFVTADGEAMLPDYGRRAPPADVLARYEARIRRARVPVPPGALRRGANVVAIELHRAPWPEDLPAGRGPNWDTVGLLEARLIAPAGSAAAVRPNVAPPAGVQAWTAPALLRIGVDADYGDPFEPPRPIRLAAPRNGVASGQVVISAAADAPRLLPAAKAGELKSPSGGAIPASAVRVRYARLEEEFVALLDDPAEAARAPAEPPADPRARKGDGPAPGAPHGQLRPIWLTVKVPPDAAPGVYAGTLAVEGPGLDAPMAVPVELTVFGWRVGDPKDWRTVVNLLQSPESVAGTYGAPLWSDRHFELLAKSFELMGQAGNDVLGVSAVGKSVFGNDPLVVFRKDGARYVPELKFLRRYLELYDRLAGRPQFLSLHVWNYGMYYRGAGRDGGKEEKRARTIPIVELHGEELVDAEAPIYAEPGTEEMWRAVMDGLREIVQKLGWGEGSILLGTSGDTWPSAVTVGFFRKVAPYARWRAISHGGGTPNWGPTDADRTQPNGMVVAYCERARRIGFPHDAVPGCPMTCNSRDCVGRDPFHFRALPGVNVISANYEGFCWKGLDYWTYARPDGTKRSALNADVHFGNIVGGTPRTLAMPGPGGAVATVQYEMLREGTQDAEAMIFLRDALKDKAARAKIGEGLASGAEAAMEELLCLLETGARYSPGGGGDVPGHVRRLHEAAAQVAEALGRP